MGKRRKNKKKHRSLPLFSVSFRVVAVLSMVLLLLSYLSTFVNPEKIGFMGFFGIYFLPVFLLNLTLLVIALIRRSRSFWIPLLALLPSLFFVGYFFQFPSKDEGGVPEDAVRLMTYNVGRFSSSKEKMSEGQCFAQVAKFVETVNPDIVLLQEFKTADTASIRRNFKGYYIQYFLLPYRKGAYFVGNVTLSKFPIVSGGRMRFEKSTNMVMYTDLDMGGQTVRMYNAHLESNSISLTSIVKKLGGGGGDFSDEFLQAHEKVMHSSSKRQLQTRALLEHAAGSTCPTLICGDMNDTPMSYCFTSLSRNRKDTFSEAGRGFGATYSVLWPLLRIDYVLAPATAKIYTHRSPHSPYSDHYPVITEFAL